MVMRSAVVEADIVKVWQPAWSSYSMGMQSHVRGPGEDTCRANVRCPGQSPACELLPPGKAFSHHCPTHI